MANNHLARLKSLELGELRLIRGTAPFKGNFVGRACPHDRLPLGPHTGLAMAVVLVDGSAGVEFVSAIGGRDNWSTDLRAAGRDFMASDAGARLVARCEQTGGTWCFILPPANELRLVRWDGPTPPINLDDVDSFNARQAALPDWRTAGNE